MSAEVVTVAPAPGSPEFGGVPITPEEQFASHVAWVRESGDALDARPRLWSWQVGKLGMLAGMVSGLAVSSVSETSQNLVEFGGGAAVVGLGSWAYAAVRGHATKVRSARRMDMPAQEALDLRYELYRVNNNDGGDKEKDVVLLWHGAYENREAASDADALRRMAALAKENGITKIAVHTQQANNAVRPDRVAEKAAEGKVATPMTMAQWLYSAKGLPVGGRAEKQNLTVASPDYWLEVAGNPLDEELARGIDGLLAKIAAADPRHSALRIAEDFKEAPEVRRKLLLNTLRDRLELRLGGTERDPVRGAAGAATVRRAKRHATAHIRGEHVELRVEGRITERLPLERALRMGDGRLEAFLESGDTQHRRERLTAAEFALYRTLHRQDDARASDQTVAVEKRGPISRAGVQYSPQRALGLRVSAPANTERYTTRGQTWRRIGMAALGLVMGGVLTGGPTMLADALLYEPARQEAIDALAQQHHLEPATAQAQLSQAEIDHQLDEWSGVNTVWRNWYNWRKGIHDWSTPSFPLPHIDGIDSPTRTASGVEGIGNFEDTHPHAVWNLDAHQMSAAGYWLSDTSETALTTIAKPNEGFEPGWSLAGPENAGDYEVMPMPVRPTSDWDNRPWVRVSRTVDASNFQGAGSVLELPLPILDGTEVFAVNLGGKQVGLLARQNGTFAIHVPTPNSLFKDGSLTLEYWVQPAEHVPHASDTSSNPTKFKGMTQQQEAQIQAAFRQYVPGYTEAGTDTNKQREAVYNYLKHDFLYSYGPISDDEHKRITDWASFATEVLKGKLGNCNVESTLLILADPRLTAAFGYYNASSYGSNALTTGEAHMITIDGSKIVDPVSENVFNPGKPDKSAPLLPWIILAGAVQMAGVAFAFRKPLAEAAAHQRVLRQVRRADRAKAELEAADAYTLHLAAEAAAAAAWAPSRRAELHEVSERAADPRHSWESGYARIMDPGFRDAGTPGRLQRQDWDTARIQRIHKLANRVASRPAHHRRRK
jgi:hypothetical protein